MLFLLESSDILPELFNDLITTRQLRLLLLDHRLENACGGGQLLKLCLVR